MTDTIQKIAGDMLALAELLHDPSPEKKRLRALAERLTAMIDTNNELLHQVTCIAREYRDGILDDTLMVREMTAALSARRPGEHLHRLAKQLKDKE